MVGFLSYDYRLYRKQKLKLEEEAKKAQEEQQKKEQKRLEREMKKTLRKTLFKYKLHADEELFEKAFSYIRQYY